MSKVKARLDLYEHVYYKSDYLTFCQNIKLYSEFAYYGFNNALKHLYDIVKSLTEGYGLIVKLIEIESKIYTRKSSIFHY